MLPPFVQNSVLRGLELRCSDLADNSFFALACLAHPCTLVPHKSCKSMVRFGSGMVIAHFISGFIFIWLAFSLLFVPHHPAVQSEKEPRSWFWACSEGFQTVYQYHCRLVRVHCQRHALQIATAHRETTAVVNIPATSSYRLKSCEGERDMHGPCIDPKQVWTAAVLEAKADAVTSPRL